MTRPIGLAPEPFAESLRRAHCSHANAGNPDHACIGRLTVTRDGIDLDCKSCGAGTEPLAPTAHEARGARAVVEAIGMDWTSLTPEAQRAAVSALDQVKR